MRFDFADEQRLASSELRSFLEKECSAERLRAIWATESGRSPALWARLVALGLPGALVPAEHGGLGLDEIDLVLLLEETGRAALAEPVLETAAVAVPLLRDAGDGERASRWLPAVATGEAVLTLGHPSQPAVADAHVADLLLLPAEDEIHAVPRERTRLVPQPASDPARRLFAVEWRPSRETRLAEGEAARRLLEDAFDRAALGSAAQLVGIAQALVDRAVAYAKQREQFGRPIGSFQAVQHMLATAQVGIEFARPVVYRAAHSVARRLAARSLDVSQAKATASEAAARAARAALQVHGAIGYTWEVDLHLWMKRAWALGAAWGGAGWHRRRLARALLDEPAGALSFGFEPRPGDAGEGGS